MGIRKLSGSLFRGKAIITPLAWLFGLVQIDVDVGLQLKDPCDQQGKQLKDPGGQQPKKLKDSCC